MCKASVSYDVSSRSTNIFPYCSKVCGWWELCLLLGFDMTIILLSEWWSLGIFDVDLTKMEFSRNYRVFFSVQWEFSRFTNKTPNEYKKSNSIIFKKKEFAGSRRFESFFLQFPEYLFFIMFLICSIKQNKSVICKENLVTVFLSPYPSICTMINLIFDVGFQWIFIL